MRCVLLITYIGKLISKTKRQEATISLLNRNSKRNEKTYLIGIFHKTKKIISEIPILVYLLVEKFVQGRHSCA